MQSLDQYPGCPAHYRPHRPQVKDNRQPDQALSPNLPAVQPHQQRHCFVNSKAEHVAQEVAEHLCLMSRAYNHLQRQRFALQAWQVHHPLRSQQVQDTAHRTLQVIFSREATAEQGQQASLNVLPYRPQIAYDETLALAYQSHKTNSLVFSFP